MKTIDLRTFDGYSRLDSRWIINVLRQWRKDKNISPNQEYDYPELKEYDAEIIWEDVVGIRGITGLKFNTDSKFTLFVLKYKK